MFIILRILILLVFLFPHSVSMVGIFDPLKSTPKEKRTGLAREIYKRELRRADSVTTFNGLQQLREIALSMEDKSLECYVYDLQADYFSVNRGFNALSLQYYQDAIDCAIENGLAAETAIHTFKKGMFFHTFRRYAEANQYLLEAYDRFKEVGFENVPRIGMYLHDIATFYYNIGDVESAHRFIIEALEDQHVPDLQLTMTNTLALVSQELGHESEALKQFTKALDIAIANRDSTWIGIVSDNIGLIHFKQGHPDLASPFLQTGYEESLKHGEPRIAVQALLYLVRCSLLTGDISEAEKRLKMTEPLVAKVNVLDRWMMFYETRAMLHESKKQSEVALGYWKQFGQAKDSLRTINNLAAVDRVKLQHEIVKHQAQVNLLKAEARTEVVKRNFVIAVLFLLMVISLLIYNRQVVHRKNEKELFEKQEALLKSEKARAEEDLRSATRILGQYTENIKEKNELIEGFRTEMENLQRQSGQADRERNEYIEKLMQAHIMTDETWHEFKQLFDKVHNGFLTRARSRFSFITETDVRLLALIKLGLNNREMANMLGVTTEAIKKSRQRLRKKIDLPEEESLERVVSLI